MGTSDQSKIKTASRQWHCSKCGTTISRGERYWCWQTGQRSSMAYCLSCARELFAEEPGMIPAFPQQEEFVQLVVYVPRWLRDLLYTVAKDRQVTIDRAVRALLQQQVERLFPKRVKELRP